jgi:hypothetical protein
MESLIIRVKEGVNELVHLHYASRYAFMDKEYQGDRFLMVEFIAKPGIVLNMEERKKEMVPEVWTEIVGVWKDL